MEGECPCGRCRLCRAGAAPIAARRRPTGYMGNRDGLETAVELFVRRVQAVQFSWPTSGTGDEKRDVPCMCILEVRKCPPGCTMQTGVPPLWTVVLCNDFSRGEIAQDRR